jgi:cytidine deaminase
MTQKKSRARSEIKSSQLDQLRQEAERYRKRAYAPYSSCQVGAAILTADQKVFGGCNVENASYGGTICAERTAILKAVSEGAKTPLQAVYVTSSRKEPWPPCGLCLQVMSEFCSPDTIVMISGQSKSSQKMFRFKELLPESFDPSYLIGK